MPDRRSALAHIVPDDPPRAAGAVSLMEIAAAGTLCLRGDPGDRAFLSAVGGVLDLVLPTEPNTVTGAHGVTVLWAGPDEWLVTLPDAGLPETAARLTEALAGIEAAVLDLSDARTVLRVEGHRARDLLAKGCPLDLHPRTFRVGRVAQSLMAGTSIMLHQIADDRPDGDGPVYDLYVPRSFADHLWRWLQDAAGEYAA